MFKKILVPVDGSETSWRALSQAIALGEKFDGELIVVNVIQPYNNAALLAVPLDDATINQSNSELEKIGDQVLGIQIGGDLDERGGGRQIKQLFFTRNRNGVPANSMGKR